MRSPNQAVLWEIWRVTRVEIAWRFALCIAGGLVALSTFAALAGPVDPGRARDFGALAALVIIIMPNWLGWMFLGRLNKGRAGYPMPLLFTRPIGTFTLIAVQFAYLTAVQVAIYLTSALVLKVASGYPFPFLAVAAWIAASTLMMTSIYWSSRSVLVQQFLGGLISGVWLVYAIFRLTSFPEGQNWHDSPSLWPAIFQLTPRDWLMLALISAASFGITVYSVARQRRGDARTPWTPGSGWPDWIVSLFRLPCPTSSATRAQMWFDLKSRGLPLLSLGLLLAIVNPLLFAISNRVDAANPDWEVPLGPMAMLLSMMSVLTVMVLGGLNAFGIRWRQGGTYFEATQPYSTVRLANLKVFVRSICLVAALLVVGGSMWAFLSAYPLLTGDKLFWKMTGMAHIVFLQGAERAFGALAGYEKLSLVVVAFMGVFVWVASLAVILPLWARYPRRGNIAASVLLIGGLSLSTLVLAGRLDLVPEGLVVTAFAVTRWLLIAATLFVTIYLAWDTLAERLLRSRDALGAVAVAIAFGAASLTLLHSDGLRLADLPASTLVSVLTLLLVPLMLMLLVPWSLSRYRHL
jgi:hypothetical protein